MTKLNRNTTVAIALVVSTLLLLFTYHRSWTYICGGVHDDCAPLPQQHQLAQEQGKQKFTRGKPRYIFVDLGANKADTLEVFLNQPGAKFRYNYPRPEWATHEEAEIFLFEANPVFNPDLVHAKEKYDEQGIKVTIFPSTVVDVRDGIRTFFLDTVNDGKDYWGSSIYSDHPDVIRSASKGTDLTAVNIAVWLLRNTLPRDFVVVKMDIEGAEHEVVPHLVEMRAWSVIDHLLIEWHSPSLGGGDAEEIEARRARAYAAVEKLKQEGVQAPTYDSSA
ncbi:hypothetical protein BG006_011054 [Podila minutissima]|uniref:Methyltransferase FkbM domain-containing protein n=1 Tax=Podila minutissima TaxID=64525 RepID=A0A9P5SQ38_9FUNG|nr:hypothetical protein BG006_011054 [Podila minutissima]